MLRTPSVYGRAKVEWLLSDGM